MGLHMWIHTCNIHIYVCVSYDKYTAYKICSLSRLHTHAVFHMINTVYKYAVCQDYTRLQHGECGLILLINKCTVKMSVLNSKGLRVTSFGDWSDSVVKSTLLLFQDLSSVPRIRVRQPTTHWNSRSRESEASGPMGTCTHMCPYTSRHPLYIIKIIKIDHQEAFWIYLLLLSLCMCDGDSLCCGVLVEARELLYGDHSFLPP